MFSFSKISTSAARVKITDPICKIVHLFTNRFEHYRLLGVALLNPVQSLEYLPRTFKLPVSVLSRLFKMFQYGRAWGLTYVIHQPVSLVVVCDRASYADAMHGSSFVAACGQNTQTFKTIFVQSPADDSSASVACGLIQWNLLIASCVQMVRYGCPIPLPF